MRPDVIKLVQHKTQHWSYYKNEIWVEGFIQIPSRAAGTVQTSAGLVQIGQLKERAGIFVSRSLTPPSGREAVFNDFPAFHKKKNWIRYTKLQWSERVDLDTKFVVQNASGTPARSHGQNLIWFEPACFTRRCFLIVWRNGSDSSQTIPAVKMWILWKLWKCGFWNLLYLFRYLADFTQKFNTTCIKLSMNCHLLNTVYNY